MKLSILGYENGMENFDAIPQGLGTGRVSGAVAKSGVTPQLASLTPHRDPTAAAHPQEGGITAWQWDVLLEHWETPWAAEQWAQSFWCSFGVHQPWQRDCRVPRGAPASQYWGTSRQCLLWLALRN